jgi:hypothetical protein
MVVRLRYPVGFHVGTFHGGEQEPLEKKICFVYPRKGQYCGHGVAGPGKFVWALLDWRCKKSDECDECLALGGQLETRVTNAVSIAFHA